MDVTIVPLESSGTLLETRVGDMAMETEWQKQALINRLNEILPGDGFCESTMPWVVFCHQPWARVNLSDRMVWVHSIDITERLAQHSDLFEEQKGLFWLKLKNSYAKP